MRAAADAVLAGHPVVDLLVDNAGVMAMPRGRTVDGFETQLGVEPRALGRPLDSEDPHMERRYKARAARAGRGPSSRRSRRGRG